MARRSLSLQAYKALARRGQPEPQNFDTPRPEGQLVWVHLGHPQDMPAIVSLVGRLMELHPELSVLVTLPASEAALGAHMAAGHAWTVRAAPDEHPGAVRDFLNHWRPDTAIWIWGGLRPLLLDEASRDGVPLHLVSAETSGFDGRRDRWLPDLARVLLSRFETISARNAATMTRLKKLGLPADAITLEAPLRPGGHVLPCAASDLDEMSQHLAGRPVWLAAQCHRDEFATVLAAHRTATLAAHRLLLVVELADPADREELLEAIDAAEFSFGVWADGTWPEPHTQVLVADLPNELGLWYRLSTVSFLGRSLVAGTGGIDPLEAAALGTAILYGPNVSRHLQSFSRLAAAGAARIVKDTSTLAAAVSQLISPDQAATMAHAGWDVATESAAGIDRLVQLVTDSLAPDAPKVSAS